MTAIKVRVAQESDAEQLIALVAMLADEPNNNIGMGPGEFTKTIEEEQKFLRDTAASPNAVFLVACDGDRIVGCANIHCGRRAAFEHCGNLGISIHQDYRARGIGTLLMQALMDWARSVPTIRRIELNVFARNTAGIRLYEKFGFGVEGRRVQAAFKGGEYIDDYLMATILP